MLMKIMIMKHAGHIICEHDIRNLYMYAEHICRSPTHELSNEPLYICVHILVRYIYMALCTLIVLSGEHIGMKNNLVAFL